MRLTVASDLHAAEVWDAIAERIDAEFLNPNDMLRELVDTVDGPLVFNGDMIDYYYADYEGGGESNWNLFFDVLEDYPDEYYCALGNHEYRSHAYNFDLYGLQHVDIPSDLRRGLPKDLHKYFRWAEELQSILLNGVETLEDYPFPRYYKRSVEDVELLFMDTGPDAFADISGYTDALRIRDRIATTIPARGLDDAQITFLKDNLPSSGTAIVFMHCPPFFATGEPEPVTVDRSTYESISRAAGPNRGYDATGFLQNNWECIETLMESSANIIVITGHTHRTGQFLLEKESRILRGSDREEVNERYDDEHYIKFISNLPLGAIKGGNECVGYLTLDDDGFKYHVLRDFS